MRVVVFSDVHLDGGYALGDADEQWGNTRLRDARDVLRAICSTPCDVLVFAGDMATGPTPGPAALSVMQDALSTAQADAIALVMGNHDYGGLARSSLDVVAAGVPKHTHVFHHAELIKLAGLQIAALPWAPPQRFYSEGESTADSHRRCALALEDLTRGLAAELDTTRPSLLVAHWLLAGSALASGSDIISANEPLLSVADLEASGPWSAIVGGHNHAAQQVSDRSWVVGSPMRDSFGEEDLQPGYLIIDIDGGVTTVERVPTSDRPLRTVRLDPDALLVGEPDLPDVTDAVVRLVGARTDEQARALIAADRDSAAIDACFMAGAAKVIGPRWDTTRERRARSDLHVDADPRDALARWLDTQNLTPAERELVTAEAHTIMEEAA